MKKLFYNTLFKENEMLCLTDSVFGTGLCTRSDAHYSDVQFFSINPLATSRKDSNVTCFRNILLEFDTLPPAQQLELLKTVPHTTLVWSGGKSYHAIISLSTPCESRLEYDALVRRIHAKVPQCDKSTKNPSRLSRCPEVLRDSENMQTLVTVNPPLNKETLEQWLGPEPVVHKSVYNTKPHLTRVVSGTTKWFLDNGAAPGMRNSELFNVACELTRAGYSELEILELVLPVLDLNNKEIRNTIKSALRTVRS